jgi:hydrogenase maturation factor
VSSAVNRILVHVTGVGKVKKDRRIDTAGARPGMDLVITRWIGLEGTALLAKAKEQELKQRFPADFVEDAIRFRELLSVIPEAAVAAKTEAAAMHDGSWGGIFGALWELAEASGTGLVIDLKKLPIRQETVEICEYFDLNPYELLSGGTMVIATAEGEKLVAALQDKAIPAVVAGRITSGNDRLVLRDGEKRFLEPPKQDALYRILE